MFFSIDEAVSGLVDDKINEREFVQTDELRKQLEAEGVTFDGELPDFDEMVRHDDLRSTLANLGVTFDDELPDMPDMSDYVMRGDALTEDGIVDLMNTYSVGGCATARAANGMLGVWLEGVLDGSLDEQHDRLNEHIKAVVAAALLAPPEVDVVERIVEVPASVPDSQCFVVLEHTAHVVGPFESFDAATRWKIDSGNADAIVRWTRQPSTAPVVREVDPELERLLADEERIERMARGDAI